MRLGAEGFGGKGNRKILVPVTRGRYSQKHFALIHLEKYPYKYLGERIRMVHITLVVNAAAMKLAMPGTSCGSEPARVGEPSERKLGSM